MDKKGLEAEYGIVAVAEYWRRRPGRAPFDPRPVRVQAHFRGVPGLKL